MSQPAAFEPAAVARARPKVFAICDVSGSVANYARFMLMFLYSLEEVMPKVKQGL